MSKAPLWRIVLSYFVLAFVARRLAIAIALGPSELGPWVVAGYSLQVVAALFLWAALRFRGSLVVPALVLTGGMAGATALAGMATGSFAPQMAFVQLVIAAGVTAAFAVALKLGLKHDAQQDEGDVP